MELLTYVEADTFGFAIGNAHMCSHGFFLVLFQTSVNVLVSVLGQSHQAVVTRRVECRRRHVLVPQVGSRMHGTGPLRAAAHPGAMQETRTRQRSVLQTVGRRARTSDG